MEHFVDVKVGEKVVEVTFDVPDYIVESQETEEDIIAEVQEFVRSEGKGIIIEKARQELNDYDSKVEIIFDSIGC